MSCKKRATRELQAPALTDDHIAKCPTGHYRFQLFLAL
jgi:hypothetical protein